MHDTTIDLIEEKNKKRGKLVSYTFHGILLLLLFIPFFSFPDPPPGMAGILVNLGAPDQGQGTDNAPPPRPKPAPPISKPTPPTPPPPKQETPKPVPSKPEPVKEQPTEKEVVTVDNSKEIALKREKEKKAREEERKRQEALEKKQEELDRRRAEERKEREEREKERRQQEAEKRKAEAEAEAKRKAAIEAARRKAEAEAKAKAEAEAKAKAEAAARAEAEGLFSGSGNGKGKTGTAGNQGRPDGDPSGKALEGLGRGRVGGNLGNRGVLSAPEVNDNISEGGIVVVKVCVDSRGNVISANFQLRGSTTQNGQLRRIAEKNAKKFKFDAGPLDKQCGTITYDFKLR